MGLPQNRNFSSFAILREPGSQMVMRWPFDTIRWPAGEAIGATWGHIGAHWGSCWVTFGLLGVSQGSQGRYFGSHLALFWHILCYLGSICVSHACCVVLYGSHSCIFYVLCASCFCVLFLCVVCRTFIVWYFYVMASNCGHDVNLGLELMK